MKGFLEGVATACLVVLFAFAVAAAAYGLLTVLDRMAGG